MHSGRCVPGVPETREGLKGCRESTWRNGSQTLSKSDENENQTSKKSTKPRHSQAAENQRQTTLEVAREKRQTAPGNQNDNSLIRDNAGRKTLGRHPSSMEEVSCQPRATHPAKLFQKFRWNKDFFRQQKQRIHHQHICIPRNVFSTEEKWSLMKIWMYTKEWGVLEMVNTWVKIKDFSSYLLIFLKIFFKQRNSNIFGVYNIRRHKMYDTNSLKQPVQAFKGPDSNIFLALWAMWSQLFSSTNVRRKQCATDCA